MTDRLGNVRLCTDGRLLRAPASGVATYSRALRAAQCRLAPEASILLDRQTPGAVVPFVERALRWGRALLPVAAHAHPAGAGEIVGRDLFRLAQVWFDVQRRPLPVRVPGPPGIMHWSYPLPLRLVSWTNLYTVHDAIPLRQPDLSPVSGARLRRLLQALRAQPDGGTAFVTVSDAARCAIAAALDMPAHEVVDCGMGVLGAAAGGALPAGLLPQRYLLVCGSVELRKNVGRIAEAYRRAAPGLPLVIAGADGWGADAIHLQLDATPGLVRLPAVDAALMAALLGQARALLMPSLAEGFGLPVVEAMAAGTPVLTSSGGALAETAGGAALLVDPTDVDAIADGIRRLAGDDALCTALAAAGRLNAARFSLDGFADRLAGVYRAAVDRRGAPA